MTEQKVIPNMAGSTRPLLSCDRLGYPKSVGDEEWRTKLKHLYTQVRGGWVRKS